MTTTQPSLFLVQGDTELLMTRTFKASREVVFKAWTDCEAIKQWWGPRTWPTWFCEIDLRVGGTWRYCMREEGTGAEGWGKATYREVVPPEKLVYTDYFSDKDGNELSKPMEMTLTFEDRVSETVVTWVARFTSKEHRDEIVGMGMDEGTKETMERLDEYLAK